MFYGLDVHKEFIQVCQLDAKGANRKDYRIGGTAEEEAAAFLAGLEEGAEEVFGRPRET